MENKESYNIEILDKENVIVDDPKKWSRKKKSIILTLLCFLNMIGSLANSVLYPALLNILTDLGIDKEILVNALVGIFMIFWGVSPIFWASYSDMRSNRRSVFLIALLLLLASSIVCAVSNNIELLLAMRAVQACGSSVGQSVGAGCISDLYIPSERGKHYGVFYIGFFVGVLLGPVIGGSIAQNFGWRWIFWFLSIFSGVLFIFVFSFFSETFHKETSATLTNISYNPFLKLKLLKSKNASFMIIYCLLSGSTIYVQHIIVPRILIIDYGFNSFDVGLIYLAPGLGFIVGSLVGGRWSDIVYNILTKKNNNVSYPELRINSTWVGAILAPLTYMIYGWLLEIHFNMILPLVLMFIFSLSTQLVINPGETYLVDAHPEASASIIALNKLFAFAAAGIMSVLILPMVNTLGIGWSLTLLASFNIFSIGLLILIYLKGKEWRENQQVS